MIATIGLLLMVIVWVGLLMGAAYFIDRYRPK